MARATVPQGGSSSQKGARAVALEILLRAELAGQYADRALDAALSRVALDSKDKGLVTALFYGVIEHRITLDHIIDALATVAPSAIEKQVRMILREALYQLLYLDRVPDHAAVSEAVALSPRRSKGFVNAVLRSFCRNGKRVTYPDRETEPFAYLSVRYSVPVETATHFCRLFGMARTEALLSAFAVPVPITVRVNTLRLSREEFLVRVPGSLPTKNAPYGVYLPADAPLHTLLESGLCFVQDEASQLAVAALGATRGARVLDLCAAPGSKSFGAALDMQNTGEVKSFDLHENKLSLIRRGAEVLGITSLTAAAADARAADRAVLGEFSHVICDVPCSGFGVLAKKPDIRYKNINDAVGLVPVQAAILEAAAPLVAEGGVLLYSTCTLLPPENEEQVAAFLKKHPEFSPESFTVGEIQTKGMLTLAPDTHGTDGFFIAKLRRKKG
ncbi:MAG: 16S rRNA (cytosine(967)-C(5))-methyltransferase RsmB [Ruminococcaceae bacterium]|nr:16S rRNA (cytosine(967)-C(5))-methyltransferase RsmB [Oscillospiraceae bacterium]